MKRRSEKELEGLVTKKVREESDGIEGDSLLASLPPELIQHIVLEGQLMPSNILSLSLSCYAICSAVLEQPMIWKGLYEREFGHHGNSGDIIDWKQEFRKRWNGFRFVEGG